MRYSHTWVYAMLASEQTKNDCSNTTYEYWIMYPFCLFFQPHSKRMPTDYLKKLTLIMAISDSCQLEPSLLTKKGLQRLDRFMKNNFDHLSKSERSQWYAICVWFCAFLRKKPNWSIDFLTSQISVTIYNATVYPKLNELFLAMGKSQIEIAKFETALKKCSDRYNYFQKFP